MQAAAVQGAKPPRSTVISPPRPAAVMPSTSFSGHRVSVRPGAESCSGRGRNSRQPWTESSRFTRSKAATSSSGRASAGSRVWRT